MVNPKITALMKNMLKNNLAKFQYYISLYRHDLIALFLAAVIGTILSIIPHILWFFKTGTPEWFADSDDLLYLAYSAFAYYNHPLYLSDPVLMYGGSTMYPWLQLIPGVIITKLLGINPIYINIVWRIWSGISIPIGWYLLTRLYLKNVWMAFLSTTILITDIGVHSCWLIYRHFTTVTNIALGRNGDIFLTYPSLYYNWRIITPGLSLGYLLLHLWLTHLALIKPSRKRVGLAVVSFGLLFYVYFYFWTCVALALFISILLDAKNRKVYLNIGIFGSLLGLPQLISNILIKANSNKDWLPRTDNFISIHHFSELLLPSLALILVFITFFWVILRRKDLIYLWSLGISGLLLSNHQVITGLQIQNFHWIYCYGPAISLLVMLMFNELISLLHIKKRTLIFTGLALLSVYLSTGIWLRSLEATQTKESVGWTTSYHKYIHQRLDRSDVILKPRAVVAGDEQFLTFAIISENQRPLSGYTVNLSPAIDNSEWDDRITLNNYLKGIDRTTFLTQQNSDLSNSTWGPWIRDKNKLAERINSRLKYFDQIVSDPNAAVKKFQVRYVILQQNQQKPEYLNTNWKLLQNGPYWRIWENTLCKE